MRVPLLHCLLVVILALPLSAARVYFIGNSVTDTINYNGLKALSEAGGDNLTYGRQMIPGAPLDWLWNHPNDGFNEAPYGLPSQALPNYPWDVLSLQPFDRLLDSDLEAASNFLGQLYGASAPTMAQSANRAGTRILIYGRWAHRDDPASPTARSYEELWNRPYTGGFGTEQTADYFRRLVEGLRGRTVSGVSLAARVYLVPVGHVMYELHLQMRAGQVPGYSNIYQLYTDGVHLNGTGAYIAALTYYTVIHRQSPLGLPVPSQYGTIDPALVTRIQETIWNVVRTQSLSGVPSDGSLVMATLAVPPAYRGQPYNASLLAIGGTEPRVFTRSAGALPAGITLSDTGLLSGTPSQEGEFSFTVTVTDGSSPQLSTAQDFTLRVDLDTDPVILTTSLPATSRGARYHQALAALGGNGDLTWSLASGTLPQGLSLGGGGVLTGCPLESGEFSFSVQVADTDTPVDTDTQAYTLQVDAATADTLEVSRTTSPVRLDGQLAETHWALPHTLHASPLGAVEAGARFGVLWDAENLYLAVQVTDARLFPGPANSQAVDGIEIYLDAFNDKQAEFNRQHRQFRLALDGALLERGGRASGVRHGVVWTPGGYVAELSVPWTNLGISPVGGTTVIGLDVAVNEADAGVGRLGTLRFGGVDPVDPRPAQFGNAILVGTEVAGTGGEPHGSDSPQPLAYEPFDYAEQPLQGSGGAPSFGWREGWAVEGDNNTGFAVAGLESLRFGGLSVSGRAMTGGHGWATCGRYLDESGAFAAWRRADGRIGKDGTTLYLSWLAKATQDNAEMKFSLDDDGSVVHDNNGILRVRQDGGYWVLELLGGTVRSATTRRVTTGQVNLMVAELKFTAAGDTVRLWVNPTLGAEPDGAPAAVASTTLDLRFSEVNLFPGSGIGRGQFDEIRWGSSWASVLPTPAIPVAPVTYEPAPSIYPKATWVRLQSATPGATIHYTLDGSIPDRDAPVYVSPIELTTTATLRALAVVPGSIDAPPSGAHYVIDGFRAWLLAAAWPTELDPTLAPDADGLALLLRYALGAAPTGPVSVIETEGTHGLPRVELAGGGLRYIFVGRDDPNLRYFLEASSDLGDWVSTEITQSPEGASAAGGFSLQRESLDGGHFRLTLEGPAIPGNEPRFLRLRVGLAAER